MAAMTTELCVDYAMAVTQSYGDVVMLFHPDACPKQRLNLRMPRFKAAAAASLLGDSIAFYSSTVLLTRFGLESLLTVCSSDNGKTITLEFFGTDGLTCDVHRSDAKTYKRLMNNIIAAANAQTEPSPGTSSDADTESEAESGSDDTSEAESESNDTSDSESEPEPPRSQVLTHANKRIRTK